ncbi:hypothetical protein B0187_03905 [Haemophilus paracuniculus]|uniref:EVE domain-containing protein n=1 Tax=Haemophilus paracuniculus TaxID=734 RepID=A0A1T0ATR5_9PAST|nr:hypothetical protein [Haemophilus paracuniculus]OOR99961.1 hypothetical protein B0187_03905 [Haemophilus paracuniculus]
MSTSFIDNRTEAYNQRNQDKITLSLRLSVKDDLILQELADTWETTRQDIINDLIQEYIIKEWNEKRSADRVANDEFDNSSTTNYFLLNTNKANDIADHDFMIKQKVAAAFEDGYKEKICRIKKGDYVFLYASGQGIVAYGQAASEEVEKMHHYGVENKTFFKKLDNFTDLSEQPIKARQVKSVLGRSFPFAQTLAQIIDGDKLLKFVQENVV